VRWRSAPGGWGTIAVIVRQEIVLFIMGGRVSSPRTLSVMIQVLYFQVSAAAKAHLPDGPRCTTTTNSEGWKEIAGSGVRFWIITMMLVLFGLSTLKLR